MRSIRDVAVFAWAVTGINPTLAHYGQNRPRLGAQPSVVDGLPAWEPDPRPTTYPPPEDLPAGSSSAATKEAPFGRARLYPAAAEGPPIHGYRTRHASLDEGMYDSGSTAGWAGSSAAASPYHYGSAGATGGYEPGGYLHQQQQHGSNGRRPPLRPAFSYDALQDHARFQQQQQQLGGCTSAVEAAAARRCGGFREEVWTAGPGYGVREVLRRAGGGGMGPAGGGGSRAESSKAAAAAGRYFW
jgi:hypothetical protein